MAQRLQHVQEFLDSTLPYALRASEATALPVSLVLALWATESGWGRSQPARVNNLGSIRQGDGFAAYPTLDDFVEDFIRVMRLRFYDAVLAAARSRHPVEEIAYQLGQSPYAESHFRGGNHPPGWLLVQVIRDSHLADYDRPPSPAGPDVGGTTPATGE